MYVIHNILITNTFVLFFQVEEPLVQTPDGLESDAYSLNEEGDSLILLKDEGTYVREEVRKEASGPSGSWSYVRWTQALVFLIMALRLCALDSSSGVSDHGIAVVCAGLKLWCF